MNQNRTIEKDKFSILVVDDEKEILEFFRSALEEKGYDIAIAQTGEAAIQEAKKTTYDCAFIDMVMPGLNGLETFIALKEINPKIQVVIMTAYSVENLIKESLERGAFTCLYKPFKLEELYTVLTAIARLTGYK